jgi:hypothetical protein
MLLLRGNDGRPRYSAQEALAFVVGSVGRKDWCRAVPGKSEAHYETKKNEAY